MAALRLSLRARGKKLNENQYAMLAHILRTPEHAYTRTPAERTLIRTIIGKLGKELPRGTTIKPTPKDLKRLATRAQPRRTRSV